MTSGQAPPVVSHATVSPPPKASRAEIFAWCMFDFANSSYTTVIITVAYSVYFVKTVCAGGGLHKDTGKLLFGVATLISQVIVLLTAPVVGAVADFSAAKKRFLFFTYAGCILGTLALALVRPGDVILGMLLFAISNLFYSSGENLIAAFLPEIATEKSMGRISGLGWALGYLGGLGCLFACYPFLSGGFGPEQASSVRIAFAVTALFFLAGGALTFLILRERARARPLPGGAGYVAVGFRRVLETLAHVRRYRQLFRFLVVFLLYSSGINVVVYFASIYAEDEIRMTALELMKFFMIVQLSASLGAFLFGFIQDRIGSKASIVITLLIWLGVCFGAYLSRSAGSFYVVGNLAGLAMGSAQSAGRAVVGMFTPPARSGEFFGFWGLSWKLSSAIGPFLFGLLSYLLQGSRPAVLLTSLFFVFGLAGMLLIDEGEGRRAAQATEAAEEEAVAAATGSGPR